MAVQTIFKDENGTEMQVLGIDKELIVAISGKTIVLSRLDAIKLSKEIKKQINVINVNQKMEGVNNGNK